MLFDSSSRASLVGKSETHLCSLDDAEELGARMHVSVIADFLALRDAARSAGFDMSVYSAFRDFERQRAIWNRKATGAFPVLDTEARPIDIATLSPRELVYAILRWSALPGASRHHWGTDLDIYDAASTPAGYEIQLIPAEVEHGGMHAPMHKWLDGRIEAGKSFGFYRPYDRDRGGVAPERWHLSHAPTAARFLAELTPALLRETIAAGELALGDVVLEELDELYARFVTNINPPPPSSMSARSFRPVLS